MNPSTLSMGARGLRAHIAKDAGLDVVDIGIGHPASLLFSGTDAPVFSIFFYKLFSACNSGDDHRQRPLDAVAHCILTPLSRSTNEDGGASAGEKDLMVLGHVMHRLHSEPRFRILGKNDEPSCEVEIIPLDLSTDELNKIVPTPPEGGFRPSAAYIVSLLPMPLEYNPDPGPLVEVAAYNVHPDVEPLTHSGSDVNTVDWTIARGSSE